MKINGKEAINVIKIAETIHGDIGYAKEQLTDKVWKHDIWVPENEGGKHLAYKIKDQEKSYIEIKDLQKIITAFGGEKIINPFKREYEKFISAEKNKEKKIRKKFKRVSRSDKEWFLNLSEKEQREILGI